MYTTKVAPLFQAAGIATTVVVTTHAGHATEVVQEMPVDAYDCVVGVGGDGSVCEVFQGLMKRPDWNRAIRMPVGVIPGGSGNGLSASIQHRAREQLNNAVSAAYVVAKGQAVEIDIASMRNHQETVYSFLSLEWALIADVDIESEKLRALGGARFTVLLVQKIFFTSRKYEGVIEYLVDGDGDCEEGQHPPPPPRYFDDHDPDSSVRPALDLIDGRNGDDAGKWVTLDSHFRIVWIMNVTHAAADGILAPDAQLDDGYMYLVYMDGKHSKKSLVSMLLDLETGKHVHHKNVRVVKTRYEMAFCGSRAETRLRADVLLFCVWFSVRSDCAPSDKTTAFASMASSSRGRWSRPKCIADWAASWRFLSH